MRVPLGHDRRLMSQQVLHLVQINPRLDESRRERVAEIMEAKIFDLRFVKDYPKRTPQMA